MIKNSHKEIYNKLSFKVEILIADSQMNKLIFDHNNKANIASEISNIFREIFGINGRMHVHHPEEFIIQMESYEG